MWTDFTEMGTDFKSVPPKKIIGKVMTGRDNRGGIRCANGPGGRLRSYTFLLLFFLLAPAVFAADARGTELRIPDLKGKSGQEIRVPLVIDQTANLAGLKLILHYDKEILTFKEGVRSQGTQSLMHIINDKTPGKLIVVMAGARGVQGKEMTLLTLTFAVRKGLTGNHTTVIESPEVQLMGDDLREIECRFKTGTLTILP
jgi:hypothetical protein